MVDILCGTCGVKVFYSQTLVKWLHLTSDESHKVTTPPQTSEQDRRSDRRAGKEYGA